MDLKPSVVVIDSSDSFKSYSENLNLNNYYDFKWVDSKKNVESYKDNIFNGEIEILLIFDADFDQMLEERRRPNVERYYNGIEDYSSEARYNMDQTLMDYETYLLGIRIGNPEHVSVFDLNKGIEQDALHD